MNAYSPQSSICSNFFSSSPVCTIREKVQKPGDCTLSVVIFSMMIIIILCCSPPIPALHCRCRSCRAWFQYLASYNCLTSQNSAASRPTGRMYFLRDQTLVQHQNVTYTDLRFSGGPKCLWSTNLSRLVAGTATIHVEYGNVTTQSHTHRSTGRPTYFTHDVRYVVDAQYTQQPHYPSWAYADKHRAAHSPKRPVQIFLTFSNFSGTCFCLNSKHHYVVTMC